jgi:hypothetical protein
MSGLPGRVLLDTNILRAMYDEGEFLFDGYWEGEAAPGDQLIALKDALLVARRLQLQFVTSPLSIAEIVNIQSIDDRSRLLSWFLEMLNYWIVELDLGGDRLAVGGTVRHRFKLSKELQGFEQALMSIPDFRRDPFDRLLLIHHRMANCDAFLTLDTATIWKHQDFLKVHGVNVMLPTEYWECVRPYAAL